ncbi:uncharacterized protein EV420DRAFT_1473216 [Desarmillaria tabescens]|uniref:Uncharacterized protein n=1 Tax=Armillaria tabescens TaxID=1929756 RepID=A0AA39NR68_ARMTA|nr:uncharacterized protein EV420DRAFT_1473216 [Desarmillaria tabescens]KAK0470119.1 hypothetical protein EV420DRAFT_1473216 [Desarmillaria tabescens]
MKGTVMRLWNNIANSPDSHQYRRTLRQEFIQQGSSKVIIAPQYPCILNTECAKQIEARCQGLVFKQTLANILSENTALQVYNPDATASAAKPTDEPTPIGFLRSVSFGISLQHLPEFVKLQPLFMCSHLSRHLSYTRTELEGELFDIREGLMTLLDLVDHPKAINFLWAAKDYCYEHHPESSDEDRWVEVTHCLKMPQNYNNPNQLIYDLMDFSPPQLYLPPSLHAETYKTGWKYLESLPSNSHNTVIPGEQVLFHGLSSLFTVSSSCQDREPISYQIKINDQIKLVVIEEEDLWLPNPEVLKSQLEISEKLFSILMHAYNEFLDHWYKCITTLPQGDLTEVIQCDRTLQSLVEEAIQYANLATAQLGLPKNECALKRGLDDLHKRLKCMGTSPEGKNQQLLARSS